MEKMIGRITERWQDAAYAVFRVAIGLLFSEHGAQKVLGLFGATPFPAGSLMWLVGTIELLGGLAIALGVFARLAVLGTASVMVGAYATVHAPQAAVPIMNGGELTLLYLASFILVIAKGSGKASLEWLALKREVF